MKRDARGMHYDDWVCKCKLQDSGKIVEYDLAHNTTVFEFTDISKYELIGRGTIYSVDGKIQNSETLLYFYRRIG
jgi:hypothetical protein